MMGWPAAQGVASNIMRTRWDRLLACNLVKMLARWISTVRIWLAGGDVDDRRHPLNQS